MTGDRAEVDARFMQRALDEAVRGRGTTQPNPMVGAVVVRDGEVIATGYHERAGAPHAEPIALARAGEAARGATLYVNLEPCSHFGRTPPCTDAVIAAGVSRVVAAMIDPNPRVSGEGMRRIAAAGIETTVGVLGDEAWRLNADFIVHIREQRPLVTVKVATSLDGRIATSSGDSRWISSAASRQRAHVLRRDAHAILVGRRTLMHDDPRLTTRLDDAPDAPSPHRYVLDAGLDAPPTLAAFDVAAAPTTVVCRHDAPAARRAALEAHGVEVLVCPHGADGRVDLHELLAMFARRNVLSLLVEGGGALAGALHDAGLVDRWVQFVAPLLLGGADAVPSLGGVGSPTVAAAHRAHRVVWEQVGDDLMVTADIGAHLVPAPLGANAT